MSERKPLVAGNWKMNGRQMANSNLLDAIKSGYEAGDFSSIELAVFPPFLYADQANYMLNKTDILKGLQCVSEHQKGAYTGSISANMAQDMGMDMVLAGHSERRHLLGETDDMVARQVLQITKEGLAPVLCVGETKEERQNGEALSVIKRQLAAVFGLYDNPSELNQLIIAYEPVWAIGTGDCASPEDVLNVHAFIREELKSALGELAHSVRLLYGGSVKANNAAELFALENVDGALIGGASLDAEQFLEIAKLCCIYC